MKILSAKQRNSAKWNNANGAYSVHGKLVIELTRNSAAFRRCLKQISTNTGQRTTGRGPGKYL